MAATMPAKGVAPAAGKEEFGSSRRTFSQVLGKAMKDALDDTPTDSTAFRKDGNPALRLSDSDVARGESHVSNHIVVMKFSSFRPSLDSIRDSIHRSWGISGEFIMGLIDPRHVMVYLQSEEEVKKVLSNDSFTIRGVRYKMFRWHPGFSLRADPELAPLWVELPNLPFAFFLPAIMKAIGDSFGNFLRIDDGTRYFARPKVARMCVEMEVSKPLPHKIWLESPKYGGYWQKLEYPGFKYCDHCSLIGHEKDYCRKLVGKKREQPTSAGEPYKDFKSLDKAKLTQTLGEEKQHQHVPTQMYVPVAKKAMKTNGNIGTSGAKNSQGVEITSDIVTETKERTKETVFDNVISSNQYGVLAEEASDDIGEGDDVEIINSKHECQIEGHHTKIKNSAIENTQDVLRDAGYTNDNAENAQAKSDDGSANAAPLWIVPFVADTRSESAQATSNIAESEDRHHINLSPTSQSDELDSGLPTLDKIGQQGSSSTKNQGAPVLKQSHDVGQLPSTCLHAADDDNIVDAVVIEAQNIKQINYLVRNANSENELDNDTDISDEVTSEEEDRVHTMLGFKTDQIRLTKKFDKRIINNDFKVCLRRSDRMRKSNSKYRI